MSGTSPCQGCGRVMEWATTTTGAKIPLERLRGYRVDPDGIAHPAGDVLVSHFQTCPKASDFSKGRKP